MLKKILLVLALLYTIALAVISLLNLNDIPTIELENGDKIAHAVAYSLLNFIWYLTLKTLNFSKPLLVASCGAIIYGIIFEVLQGTLTAARTPDVYDVVANSIGVVFMSIIIMIINKTHVKNL